MVGRIRTAASIIGIVAGGVGAYHGYNEVLQGNVTPGGIFINAIGPPCQGSSCFPAMTVVPDFYATGLLAILLSVIVVVWSALLLVRKGGGMALIVLSVVLLLVGGGFLPPALGIIAGAMATKSRQ